MRKFRTSMTMMCALIGMVLAMTLSLGTLGAAAAPASAATNLSYFLTAGTAGITSGGHTWKLNVSLIGGSSGGPVIIDVLIETPHLSGTEIHDWGMQMPGADFTVDKTTGAAAINSHSDLSPVASLNLSYKPTSHTAGTCSSGSETDYLGTLTGSGTLTTGLKGLKLSDAKATFSTPTRSRSMRPACRLSRAASPRGAAGSAVRRPRPSEQGSPQARRAPGALHRRDQEGVPLGPGRGDPH
jgi:hypothetical protein